MKTHASFMSYTTRRAYHLILHCIFLVQCSTAQHILWNIEVWSLLALLLDVYPGLNLHSVLMCLWWQADRVTCSPGPASVVSVDQQRWGFLFLFCHGSKTEDWGQKWFLCVGTVEWVRLCLHVQTCVGGQRLKRLQLLTFPNFRGTQLQVIPCVTVRVEIGSRDPALLLCSADKPPTYGNIQRL